MLEGSGWRVKWSDGSLEMVASWAMDADAMVPYVLADDGKSLVSAATRGEYTLSHPQQFTRSAG
jgi:hypothetical protein